MMFVIVTAAPSPIDIADANAGRFLRDTSNFCDSLEKNLGIGRDAMINLHFGVNNLKDAASVKKEIESILLEHQDEDLCLVYIGHGQESGWALSGERDNEALAYDEMRLTFALHSGNLIFLNCCCYGGAGISALESHSGENLLISPLPATHSGYVHNFLSTAIRSWKYGNFYDPYVCRDNLDSKPVVSGNQELQKLFFLSGIPAESGGVYAR